jgi:hypothetical protein
MAENSVSKDRFRLASLAFISLYEHTRSTGVGTPSSHRGNRRGIGYGSNQMNPQQSSNPTDSYLRSRNERLAEPWNIFSINLTRRIQIVFTIRVESVTNPHR